MTEQAGIAEVLNRYRCPYPLPVVRMRFWGAINSPASSISPTTEINDAWEGKPPKFKTTEEADAFYTVMIGFWNSLALYRKLGTFVPFEPRSGMGSISGLREMILMRIAELNDGFFSGFIGQLTPHEPMNGRVEEELDRLGAVIEVLEELAEVPIGPNNSSRIRSRFVALDRRAQKLVNQLVTLTRVSSGAH